MSIETRRGKTGVSYLVRVPTPNGPHRTKTGTFKTKKDAERKERQWLTERDGGVLIDAGKLTLAGFAKQWVDSLRHTKLAVSSRRRYADALRLYILPTLGRYRLDQLTPVAIQGVYADLMDGTADRKPLSAKTANLAHNVLHRCLKAAVNSDLLNRNPTERVTPPPRPKAQIKCWTTGQTAAFLAVANNDEYQALWQLAIETGMRRGELLGLKWSSVRLDQGALTVETSRSRAEKGRFADGATKTRNSRRTFRLSAEMVEILKQHREQQRFQQRAAGLTGSEAGYVFAQPNGRPLHPNTVTRRYKALIAEAGVPDARIHDARHASATLGLESGESIKDVSQRLGHSSTALTMDLYMHPSEERQRENADRLAAFLKAAGERG